MRTKTNELNRYEEFEQIAFNCARYGKTEDLRVMLNTGMSVDLCDNKGNTLLMLAAYNGNFETTKLLIDYGANIDKKNFKGQTPLGGVCFKGDKKIAELLVKKGANIYKNNGFKTTPLMFAAIFGNYEIVKFFSEIENNSKITLYLYLSKFFNFFKRLFK